MNKKERIEELQEKMDEYILNESVFPDDSPSWEEVLNAQAEAESRWNETDEGKELTSLLDDEQEDYDYTTQKNFD